MIESPIVAGLLKISIRLNVLLISLSVYRNPVKAVMALRRLTLLMRSNSNNRRAPRFARSGKRIYVAINIPGWPSRGFNHFMET